MSWQGTWHASRRSRPLITKSGRAMRPQDRDVVTTSGDAHIPHGWRPFAWAQHPNILASFYERMDFGTAAAAPEKPRIAVSSCQQSMTPELEAVALAAVEHVASRPEAARDPEPPTPLRVVTLASARVRAQQGLPSELVSERPDQTRKYLQFWFPAEAELITVVGAAPAGAAAIQSHQPVTEGQGGPMAGFQRKGSKLPPPVTSSAVLEPAASDSDPHHLVSGGLGQNTPRRPQAAGGKGGEFRIQKGVPLPPRRAAFRESRYPFAAMEVGDSFFVPKQKHVSPPPSQKLEGRKFVQRRMTEGGVQGVGVWRIK